MDGDQVVHGAAQFDIWCLIFFIHSVADVGGAQTEKVL